MQPGNYTIFSRRRLRRRRLRSGLSLCREIARAYGGDIAAANLLGGGSAFVFDAGALPRGSESSDCAAQIVAAC